MTVQDGRMKESTREYKNAQETQNEGGEKRKRNEQGNETEISRQCRRKGTRGWIKKMRLKTKIENSDSRTAGAETMREENGWSRMRVEHDDAMRCVTMPCVTMRCVRMRHEGGTTHPNKQFEKRLAIEWTTTVGESICRRFEKGSKCTVRWKRSGKTSIVRRNRLND